MYMPVHFVWNIEILQAYIFIQYFASLCQILSRSNDQGVRSFFFMLNLARATHSQCYYLFDKLNVSFVNFVLHEIG
jgi:hypothetical protein